MQPYKLFLTFVPARNRFLIQELCASTLGIAWHVGLFHNPSSREPYLGTMLTVFTDVALGLAYLHSRNIVHGDIKPANILLKTDKSSPAGLVAKLSDFGLSLIMAPDRTHVSNYQRGTPYYVRSAWSV